MKNLNEISLVGDTLNLKDFIKNKIESTDLEKIRKINDPYTVVSKKNGTPVAL